MGEHIERINEEHKNNYYQMPGVQPFCMHIYRNCSNDKTKRIEVDLILRMHQLILIRQNICMVTW